MPESDWVMVRVRRETHAELRRVEMSLRIAEDQGQLELSKDERDRVSIDQVVRRLIAIRDGHAARRQKAQQRRRDRMRARKEEGASERDRADGETVVPLSKPEVG